MWQRNLVHGALLKVPPRQRAVLVLRYFGDLDHADRDLRGELSAQTPRSAVDGAADPAAGADTPEQSVICDGSEPIGVIKEQRGHPAH